MDAKILDLLAKERVCSLTVLLPDGNPHAAAMHFSHKEDPLEIYFSTKNTSRKYQVLLAKDVTKAAVVVGFSEKEWLTLQMEGVIEPISDPAELEAAQQIHYAKNPEALKYKGNPATVLLKFTPTWWRYTDFSATPPATLSS